jgi:hypothetical protein
MPVFLHLRATLRTRHNLSTHTITDFTRIINPSLKRHPLLMESRVEVKLSRTLGLIWAGQCKNEELGWKRAAKTPFYIYGNGKEKSTASQPHESNMANEPKMHLTGGRGSPFQGLDFVRVCLMRGNLEKGQDAACPECKRCGLGEL